MTETRKLAAILVADVVGYSRLAGADEDRIAVHHGRIVKRTGDGSIIEFRSVVDAVNFAIELQRAMVERNAEAAPEKRIEFRVGIHLGDIVGELSLAMSIASVWPALRSVRVLLSDRRYWPRAVSEMARLCADLIRHENRPKR